MRYPAIFFCKKKRNKLKYYFQFVEGAVLEVPRLIQQLAPWKKIKPSASENNKVLVLADWTAWKWNAKKIASVKKIMRQLLRDNFRVYQWQDGEVIHLTPHAIDKLDNVNIRKQMTPCYEENIIHTTASQHLFPEEEIHVLNHYWLEVLEQESEALPHQLDIADIIDAPHDKQLLYAVIKNQNKTSSTLPKLEEIINTEFSYLINTDSEEIIARLPPLPILNHYKTLQCTTENAEILLKQQSLALGGETITLEHLPSIESLHLSVKSSPYYDEDKNNFIIYTNILRYLPRLYELALEGDSQHRTRSKLNLQGLDVAAHHLASLVIKDCFLVPSNTLPHFSALEKLELSIASTGGNLSHLFENMPHLKYLQINTWDEEEYFLEEKDYLIELETLHLINCFYKKVVLSRFLQNKPALRSLKIESYDLSRFPSLGTALPALESLTLNSCTLSPENWNCLFLSMTRLKYFYLNTCRLVSLLNEDIALPELIKLELSHCVITTENLATLLKQAEKLESISLTSCNIKNTHTETLSRLPLSSLTTLRLEKVTMTSQHLQYLMINAPCLTNLVIRNCNVNGIIDAALNLPLRKLVIEECEILIQKNIVSLPVLDALCITQDASTEISYAESDIEYVLENTNNLRVLELCGIDLQEPFTASLYLPKLEELTLKNLAVTAENLMDVIAASSMLRSMCFTDVVLSSELAGNLSFPLLHTMTLINGDISTDNLIKFIQAMPNLIFLKLQGLSNIDENDLQLINLLQERGINIESSGNYNHHQQNNTAPAAATVPAVPVHRPDSNLTIPPPPDPNYFQFNYQGKNKTKNQDMIIEKLSQYLTLTQHPKAAIFIPKMQNGICAALTVLFDELADLDDLDNLDDKNLIHLE